MLFLYITIQQLLQVYCLGCINYLYSNHKLQHTLLHKFLTLKSFANGQKTDIIKSH
jgi:hypothetical protein